MMRLKQRQEFNNFAIYCMISSEQGAKTSLSAKSFGFCGRMRRSLKKILNPPTGVPRAVRSPYKKLAVPADRQKASAAARAVLGGLLREGYVFLKKSAQGAKMVCSPTVCHKKTERPKGYFS